MIKCPYCGGTEFRRDRMMSGCMMSYLNTNDPGTYDEDYQSLGNDDGEVIWVCEMCLKALDEGDGQKVAMELEAQWRKLNDD